MQSETAQNLKYRLRKTFGDDYGIQWSDAILNDILVEAQREYALYSGALTGQVEISAGQSPVQSLPDDFVKIIRIISNDGDEIPVVSYRKLIEDYGDFRKRKGNKAESICLNFDGFGKFRIFPVLPAGTAVGKIIYSRLPNDKLLEVKNISALEQYALFQMFQFTGKAQAQNCYISFIKQIERENKLRVGTGSKYISRKGVYF